MASSLSTDTKINLIIGIFTIVTGILSTILAWAMWHLTRDRRHRHGLRHGHESIQLSTPSQSFSVPKEDEAEIRITLMATRPNNRFGCNRRTAAHPSKTKTKARIRGSVEVWWDVVTSENWERSSVSALCQYPLHPNKNYVCSSTSLPPSPRLLPTKESSQNSH